MGKKAKELISVHNCSESVTCPLSQLLLLMDVFMCYYIAALYYMLYRFVHVCAHSGSCV